MVRVAKEGLLKEESGDRRKRKLSHCPVLGCRQSFKTWNGFCLHIGRKHKDWLRWLLKIGRVSIDKEGPVFFLTRVMFSFWLQQYQLPRIGSRSSKMIRESSGRGSKKALSDNG